MDTYFRSSNSIAYRSNHLTTRSTYRTEVPTIIFVCRRIFDEETAVDVCLFGFCRGGKWCHLVAEFPPTQWDRCSLYAWDPHSPMFQPFHVTELTTSLLYLKYRLIACCSSLRLGFFFYFFLVSFD